jgi:hypothetical protein
MDSHKARMHDTPPPSEKGLPIISERLVTAALVSFIIIILLLAAAFSQGWLFSPFGNGNLDNGGPTPDEGSGAIKPVLVELFVTTSCTSCPTAEDTLSSMYDQGTYNFSFVSMIVDMNQAAYVRANSFGISGVPTSILDGGVRAQVGAKSAFTYANDINYAARMFSSNLTITSGFQTSGNQLNLSITVLNNNQSSFSGTVFVYVVEPESRYLASNGHSIPYGFLGYALEANVNIPGSNEWSSYPQWTGTNINPDNIAVVIAVFGSDGRCQFAETLE